VLCLSFPERHPLSASWIVAAVVSTVLQLAIRASSGVSSVRTWPAIASLLGTVGALTRVSTVPPVIVRLVLVHTADATSDAAGALPLVVFWSPQTRRQKPHLQRLGWC
jgi:hypothetical protein